MNRVATRKSPLRINKRQFVMLILLVFLIGSTGLIIYTYTNLGDEYATNRSVTITGLPKFLHTIAGEQDAKLSKPLAVAVYGKNVYVADSANGKLAIFTKRGSLLRSVGLLNGSTSYPLGITLDDRGRVYTSLEVQGFYHIAVVDSYGRFQYRFPMDIASTKSKQPVLNHPVGLFYRNDMIYVTDTGDHDVKIFSVEGQLLKRFGRPGNKNGEFMFPNGITADDESIFVTDSNNSRVQVFDKNGKFKYLLKPSQKEPLVIPRGIAIDGLGRVHVVDLAQQKVFVFTKEGKYLLNYGSGKGDKGLSYPNGISTDPKAGLIYVADRMKNRIAVFSE